MERQSLLASADALMRLMFGRRADLVAGEELAEALQLDQASAHDVLTYAERKGWLEFGLSHFGEILPYVRLTRAGMEYADRLFNDRRDDADKAELTTVFNVSGANSRINISSHDQSINMQTLSAEGLLSDLRAAAEDAIADAAERQAILQSIDQLSASVGSKHFAARYAEFMQHAANHMTVFAPFVPGLTQLLLP